MNYLKFLNFETALFLYLLKVSYDDIMNTRGDFMRKIYTECPVEYTASLIANKWKILILRDLLTGTKRYNELTKSIVGISAKVLTENLRQLESDGIVVRKVYPVVPPKVEYSLTNKGSELKPIFDLMNEYGNKYKKK